LDLQLAAAAGLLSSGLHGVDLLPLFSVPEVRISNLPPRTTHGSSRRIDNRAKAMPCYDHGYIFVEKLQTLSTKFRNQQADGSDPVEFMRHYYDIYELLKRPEVQNFVGRWLYRSASPTILIGGSFTL
jgi:hypothetical protein